MARVLLVDDEPDVRRVLAEVVVGLGHVTDAAADGRAALARLRAAPFELVLLDLNMPGVDGFGVLEALGAEPPPAPPAVIIVTSSTAPADKLRGLELGAFDFVEKPFRVADLRRRIERALTVLELERRLGEAESALWQARTTDADTGVGSCSQLFEALDGELRFAAADARPLTCIAVADLAHGQGGAGAAEQDARRLQQVAALLAACHAAARLFRVGADELVVVLPGVDAEESRALAAQMLAALHRLEHGAAPFALGAATYPDPSITQASQLFHAVNLCLTRARARRGDRVVVWADES